MEKCAECGGTNIQARAWVDINTQGFIEWCDEGDNWCEDCEMFVDVNSDTPEEIDE